MVQGKYYCECGKHSTSRRFFPQYETEADMDRAQANVAGLIWHECKDNAPAGMVWVAGKNKWWGSWMEREDGWESP